MASQTPHRPPTSGAKQQKPSAVAAEKSVLVFDRASVVQLASVWTAASLAASAIFWSASSADRASSAALAAFASTTDAVPTS